MRTSTNGECYVCARWGVNQDYVGNGMIRHSACRPGSEQWADKFPKTVMAAFYRSRRCQGCYSSLALREVACIERGLCKDCAKVRITG